MLKQTKTESKHITNIMNNTWMKESKLEMQRGRVFLISYTFISSWITYPQKMIMIGFYPFFAWFEQILMAFFKSFWPPSTQYLPFPFFFFFFFTIRLVSFSRFLLFSWLLSLQNPPFFFLYDFFFFYNLKRQVVVKPLMGLKMVY